jgi:hypothetical protein
MGGRTSSMAETGADNNARKINARETKQELTRKTANRIGSKTLADKHLFSMNITTLS